jgi:hypothetical protein
MTAAASRRVRPNCPSAELDPSRQLFEQTIFPAKGSGFAIDSE